MRSSEDYVEKRASATLLQVQVGTGNAGDRHVSIYWKPRGRPYKYADRISFEVYAPAHGRPEQRAAITAAIAALQDLEERLDQA